MKKYQFRLQKLLEIKGIFEDEAERIFRDAIRELTARVEELDELRSQMRRLLKDLTDLRKLGIDIAIQMLYERYSRRLRNKTGRQIKEVSRAEELVELRREKLIEAIRNRKTLENLKIKDYEHYLQDLRRFEQSVIDDLSILRSSLTTDNYAKGLLV